MRKSSNFQIIALFKNFSSKNISRKNNIFNLNSKIEESNEILKPKNKDIKVKPYYKLSDLLKSNPVNKKTYINKNKCKISINNSNPLNSIKINQNINKNDIIKQKNIKNYNINNEGFSQNKDMNCMKEETPKFPELYNHEYDLENHNIKYNKNNKTYGILNQGTIPIIFNNHLMINQNKKMNKNKYIKSSITHRNKKKMITLIYYSPIP